MSLTIKDIQKVFDACRPASSKWFNFGLALKLEYNFLDDLESQNKDNQARLRKMLAEVLTTRHVTWSDLSDALRSPTVQLIPLADEIAALAEGILTYMHAL